MRRLTMTCLLVLSLGPALALAGQHIYKWTDAGGTVHFSDSPPPRGIRYEIMESPESSGSVGGPPDAQPAYAGSSAGNDDLSANQQNLATNTKRMCDRINNNLNVLKGTQPVTFTDKSGKPQLMTAARRAQELKTAQQQYDNYCK